MPRRVRLRQRRTGWALFDLQFDPEQLLTADDGTLRDAIDGSVKMIRRVALPRHGAGSQLTTYKPVRYGYVEKVRALMKGEAYEKLPRSREKARARGSNRFFTGIPCKHGHLVPRYVSTTSCVVCQLEHTRRNGGWQARPSKATYLNEARTMIGQRGGVLLSTEYVAAKTKLKVRCEGNHEFDISADNLKHGKWCPECKRQNHSKRMALGFWSVNKLREFARDRHGGDCLATAARDMLSKVPWTCLKPKHAPFEAVIAKVLRGQWCPACWQERREPPKPAIPFERVVEAVRERGGKIVGIGSDGIWKGSRTRLVVTCSNGHEWSVDSSNLLYAGSWCPECLNKGERIVRAIFETTFGGKFPKSKPGWLVSKKGRKLELDGYDQELKIAFEYQGPHHYSDDDYVKARDAIKRQACAERHVRLIEIDAIKRPYPADNVLSKVVEAFCKYGILETPRLPPGDVFPVELQELRDLAQKRSGRLVSDKYLGSEKHEWKCSVAEHPSWWAEPSRIRKGGWCPSCAGNRRLGIEGLRSWGVTVGLELHDIEYRGGTLAVYRWRCHKYGHVIQRSRTSILQSVERGAGPCPGCARTRRPRLRRSPIC